MTYQSITFKDFLKEQEEDSSYTLEKIREIISDYTGMGTVNTNQFAIDATDIVTKILKNQEYFKKILPPNSIYKGKVYRILNIKKMLKSKPLHDIRQLTTSFQHYDTKTGPTIFSWTKNKKEAIKSLAGSVFVYTDVLIDVYATVTIEAKVEGIDVNNLMQDLSRFPEEEEVLAFKNVPINIVSFSIHNNDEEEPEIYYVEDFEEFAELYNNHGQRMADDVS